ncbi:MAG: 4-hydroxy-3-methylbut-2-enyl diphosphate reductase [Bacteroidaceae bacterium]|nr:4-hydroxy-3-methylbut-2-enyl diphosphate reductase [Bacteroidaceae bacterium]
MEQSPGAAGLAVEIDAGSGFCFGVTTAISKAEEELARGELFCLGDIVHNSGEVERLGQRGLRTIGHHDLPTLRRGTRVLLRAHGEPPTTYETASRGGLEIIDATCPVVLQLQRRIRRVYEETPRPQIVIYGKRGHAEVLGLVGQTDGEAAVVETLDEAAALPVDTARPLALFSQTTKSLDGFHAVEACLAGRMDAPGLFRAFDTVCRQVSGRQPRIEQFAVKHDVILFVCGKKSSNGHALFAACQRRNPRSHMVDSPAAIRREWFDGARTVGICGATSTPKWLMEACRDEILRHV